MSLIHRTVFGGAGTVSSLSAPMTTTPSVTYVDVPLLTGPFGPLPTRFGVSTDSAGFIVVNTSALEGIIDCGDYP